MMDVFLTTVAQAKGRISKRWQQEYKARRIFRKTNVFYPRYAHVRVHIRG